uniref:Uncharacterized protein n=1 Tax=Physcomitrium patens TaxID=3218 RepID=A0A2K1KP69_PHYPA|nr:hypothetical protein PHYPA_006475 [Physcomitrium patens]
MRRYHLVQANSFPPLIPSFLYCFLIFLHTYTFLLVLSGHRGHVGRHSPAHCLPLSFSGKTDQSSSRPGMPRQTVSFR